jgi:hypothetical protein
MLHGSGANQSDTFYRAFVPEIGSALFPRQIELVKRCLKSERGEVDRVGATIFPGLVKVTRAASGPTIEENLQVNTKSLFLISYLNLPFRRLFDEHRSFANAPWVARPFLSNSTMIRFL